MIRNIGGPVENQFIDIFYMTLINLLAQDFIFINNQKVIERIKTESLLLCAPHYPYVGITPVLHV